MNALHSLDEIPRRGINATAIDSDASGNFICLGGSQCLMVTETEKFATTPLTLKTNRHEVSVIRWQKPINSHGKYIASASGQFVDVHAVCTEELKLISSIRAHFRNVTDIDWSTYDINALVTSSVDDVINIWDIRDMYRANSQLKVVAGAEQAKWAPLTEFVLCTAHGTDIRLWDIRNVVTPVQSAPAHMQKICCVAWHPSDPVCLVTTSLDGYIKIWDVSDLSEPRHSIGVLTPPVWKLKFSFDGQEFVSISLPQRGQSVSRNALNAWKMGELDNAEAVNCEDDIILDACWQRSQSKRRAYNYLYSVSRSGKIRPYAMSPYEVSRNSAADITTPIAIWDADTDTDRTLVDSFEVDVDGSPIKNAAAGIPMLHYGSFQYPRRDSNNQKNQGTDVSKALKYGASLSTLTVPILTVQAERNPSPSVTPLPTSDEWKVWLRAPVLSGGVMYELESLRNLGTQGLSTDEINFTRGAIALSYEHYQSGNKINFILRFHSPRMKVHRICFEVVEDGCPLNKEQASKLLELIASEATSMALDASKGTILSRTIKKIPELIDSMKVFLPQTIDIPKVAKVEVFSSGSASTEHSVDFNPGKPQKQSYSSPPPLPSLFDRFVPSPCICGARFNGSGYLVVFGRPSLPKRKPEFSKDLPMKGDAGFGPIDNASLGFKRSKSAKKSPRVSTSEGKENDTVRTTPRSLDDYNQELLIAAATHNLQSHSQKMGMGDDKTTLSIRHSPSFTGGAYSLFGNAAGVVAGTPNITTPFAYRANSASRSSVHRGCKISSSSMASGTSRSFSMQNVPLSLVSAHRYRGNSLTGIVVDDHCQTAENPSNSMVLIYDASGLMSVSKELARRYRLLDDNALQLCLWNGEVAKEAGRKDLVNAWQLVEMCVRSGKKSWRNQCSWKRPLSPPRPRPKSPCYGSEESESSSEGDEESGPWATHPFGRSLINNLLNYFISVNDYQSAAVIICILSRQKRKDFAALQAEQEALYGVKNQPSQQEEPDMSITFTTPAVELDESIKLISKESRNRSVDSLKKHEQSSGKERSATVGNQNDAALIPRPPSGRLTSFFYSAISKSPQQVKDGRLETSPRTLSKTQAATFETNVSQCLPIQQSSLYWTRNTQSRLTARKSEKRIESLLEPELIVERDEILHQYAEILFRWRMYSKVAEVMKYSENGPISLPLRVRYKCWKCGNHYGHDRCNRCNTKQRPPNCSVCQLPVRGLMTICPKCHHGGHCDHLMSWFRSNANCPVACGCTCKSSNF